MSFITKRERVFKDFTEPVPLPARNEGKLKAYSSCTDARAWSHFLSDKTEHLVEVVKRNTDVFRGKYVPCHVIVEMLLAAKNAEIARLKRKVTTLETMLTNYDQLELTCEQKCEISLAHAMIKAANKSLEELPPLELDMSAYTEGIDSEGFQTGKSGGDEASLRWRGVEWNSTAQSDKEVGDQGLGMEDKGFGPLGFDLDLYDTVSAAAMAKASKSSKLNQSDLPERCGCDASTYAHDPRLDELEDTLISKDAKLNAMQNTIAVMENDVCEPYCVYAHIFTALEKIYGTLRQNEKYRLFLDLMSTGKDTRSLDIKGKILFKLKILEKFSISLISPCSERFKYDETCECYAAQVETSFKVPQPESIVDNPTDMIRTQLIADIMDSKEMKDALEENSTQSNNTEDQVYDVFVADNYSIDKENLTRLKHLQINYEDLMNTYDDVRHERDKLKVQCDKYEELEKELEDCRTKLREYNMLYSEREYYRRRSDDLDSLKEQFIILTDETSNLETQLKAEMEINHVKSETIDELRSNNIALEKKINDYSIAFEKEKNDLLCKIKETECTIMCQEQQIKSLSSQIDKMLEHDHDKQYESMFSSVIADEVEALKHQIKSLNDALYASEDEKQRLQEQFEDKLKLINDLKMAIEEWKSTCEKTLQRNDYLEKYTEGLKEEIGRMLEENRILSQEVEEKNTAVANLISVINNKSQEINRLMNEIESKGGENKKLKKQLQDTKNKYGNTVEELECVNKEVMDSLQLARQESKELLEKVDDLLHTKEDVEKSLAMETENCNELRQMLVDAIENNKRLQNDQSSQEKNNSILLQEIQILRECNDYAVNNINCLQNDKDKYKSSFELVKKESQVMENKLKELDDLRNQLENLKLSHEKLLSEKCNLENDLQNKAKDLNDLTQSLVLTKSECECLLEKLRQSDILKDDMTKLGKDYQKLVDEKQNVEIELTDKNLQLGNLLDILSRFQTENEAFKLETGELKKAHQDLTSEKNLLLKDFDNKTRLIDNLHATLEEKIAENRDLSKQIKDLEKHHTENIEILEALRRESEKLQDKLKNYESLLNEHENLKLLYSQLKDDKEAIYKKYEDRLIELKKNEEGKKYLEEQIKEITEHNLDLEKSLVEARQQIIESASENPYDKVVQEIEEMKKEKLANNKKIRELLDKLDESDNTICGLGEDIMARDDKISLLENHINSLQDELRKLQNTLDEAVNTGEEIKDNSLKKVDQTLNKMEAHHSKATHNMKIELARLHYERAKLEEELSLTKIKSEESVIDKHKYISQIVHLQNEREIIVTDIKQIEVYCNGNSNLSPSAFGVEEILNSLDVIQKSIEAKNAKILNLDQTLQKVQNSSQLLKGKADAALKLVEKEKQKILNEKEEAVADKLKMESQLSNLKMQLEQQTNQGSKIIKDLEAEILNQKLIIGRLNDSTQDYILNLEDELKSLREIYQKSIENIDDLQYKVKKLTAENNDKSLLLDRVSTELNEKSKHVSSLQNTLNELKNKATKDVKIQMGSSYKKKSIKTQTDKQITSHLDNELGTDKIKDTDTVLDADTAIKTSKNKPSPDYKSKDMALNEVQILTAKIEPTVDSVKHSYVDYKKKRLGRTQLEQVSISSKTGDIINSDPEFIQNSNLIDIYNRDSDMQTTSSKAIKTDGDTASSSPENILQNSSKYDHFASAELPDQVSGSNNKYNDDIMYPQPGASSDKDMFVIYQDSSSNTDVKSLQQKNITGRQRPVLVEAVTLKQDRDLHGTRHNENIRTKEDEKVKQLLEITVPRIPDVTLKTVTDNSTKEIKVSGKKSNGKDPTYVKSDESHKLSRVDADLIIFDQDKNKRKEKNSTNFGLEYILASISHEINPVNIHKVNKNLHKSLSDEFYQQFKENSDVDVLSQNAVISMHSNSKWSNYSHPKSVAEQGVMVNIDATSYYENQIRQLSLQLENNEKDYKKKIEAIKAQYDNNIKGIINEHNQGVRSIQNLHEETLEDIIKIHENEVENLRSMSIEAMRKAEKLEIENRQLKMKILDCSCSNAGLQEEPVRMSSPELRKRRSKCRGDTRMLTKTNIEAFNVKPKLRIRGPCTCSLDVNVSDTIRNIFEQVDVEQRKLAEHAYLKYIANKIMTASIEALDINELSFLHLKVCRSWKVKLTKEEALQKRIDALESDMLNKQRCTQQHIAELDRQVAEERRRLQEAREAVCRCSPIASETEAGTTLGQLKAPPSPPNTEVQDLRPTYSGTTVNVSEQRSAGDLIVLSMSTSPMCKAKSKAESRATLVRLDVEERREKKLTDDPPTRLRRHKSTERSTRHLRK